MNILGNLLAHVMTVEKDTTVITHRSLIMSSIEPGVSRDMHLNSRESWFNHVTSN